MTIANNMDITLQRQLAEVGVMVPEILLPRADIDLSRWAVIACDQHTTDADYWQRVGQYVGEAPSSLRLILPEIYISAADLEQRIATIGDTMRNYLAQGLLVDRGRQFVLVEHCTDRIWHGLVVAIDLARYDYRMPDTHGAPDALASATGPVLIRPTEATIEERLPIRARIRSGATLDIPHILMLIDDVNGAVIAPLIAEKAQLERLYDFETMLAGGHISGYAVRSEQALKGVADGLTALASGATPLFAVGDGNHSLAAARATWLARTGGDMQHPARYALVELLDIRDPAVLIEPIHRVVRAADEAALRAWLDERRCSWRPIDEEALASEHLSKNELLVLGKQVRDLVALPPKSGELPAECIEAFLDRERLRLAELGSEPRIEYVHGDGAALEMWRRGEGTAILLPPIDADLLFQRIRSGGLMPRKSFSIGNAADKRYYLEARRL